MDYWSWREGSSGEAGARAGGTEWEKGSWKLETYKPGFLNLQAKQGGGNVEWKDRRNCLTFVREDRREVRLGMVRLSRELGKLVEAEEGGETVRREKGKRESFNKRVSVDVEYAFKKAIGEFCREAVKEGTFRGGYRMNLKEQIEASMGKIWS